MRFAIAINFVTLVMLKDVNCKYLLVEIEGDSQTQPPISPITTAMPPIQLSTLIQTTGYLLYNLL